MTMRLPKVRYADADGVSIAYEVRGEGPRDIVRVSRGLPESARERARPDVRRRRRPPGDLRACDLPRPPGDRHVRSAELRRGRPARTTGRRRRRGDGRRRIRTRDDPRLRRRRSGARCSSPPCTRNARPRWCSRTRSPVGSAPTTTRTATTNATGTHLAELARQLWGNPDNPWGIMVAAPSRQGAPPSGSGTRSSSRSVRAAPPRRRRSSRGATTSPGAAPRAGPDAGPAPRRVTAGVGEGHRVLGCAHPRRPRGNLPGFRCLRRADPGGGRDHRRVHHRRAPVARERPGARHRALHRHRVVDRPPRPDRRSRMAKPSRPSRRDGPRTARRLPRSGGRHRRRRLLRGVRRAGARDPVCRSDHRGRASSASTSVPGSTRGSARCAATATRVSRCTRVRASPHWPGPVRCSPPARSRT